MKCTSCHRKIDEEARICPYCGTDPRTGERFDPAPLLEKHFPRKPALPLHESALEFFRQRQSIVLGLVIGSIFLFAFGLLRYARNRNQQTVSAVPAIPLTEIADLSNREAETRELPIPEIPFQYEGNPRTVRTLLKEPGAVAPAVPVTEAPAAPSAASPGTAQTMPRKPATQTSSQ